MNKIGMKGLEQSTLTRRAWGRQCGSGILWTQHTTRRFLHDCSGLWAFVTAVSLLAGLAAAAQSGPPGYTSDNSDWWSHTRTLAFDEKSLVQNREPSVSNFQILGLELGDDMFSKAAVKLGKAPIIERGDVATGRSQVCYMSPEEHGKIHLVFEKGEVTESFYLFEGGPDWKGSDLCVKLNLVTKSFSVASGLRLGQTPAEIKAILGKPSVVTGNKLIYSFSVQKKSSAADFDRLRQQHPELNEADLHRNYEFYSLGVYIEARFSSSKLTYLAVSKAEAY